MGNTHKLEVNNHSIAAATRPYGISFARLPHSTSAA